MRETYTSLYICCVSLSIKTYIYIYTHNIKNLYVYSRTCRRSEMLPCEDAFPLTDTVLCARIMCTRLDLMPARLRLIKCHSYVLWCHVGTSMLVVLEACMTGVSKTCSLKLTCLIVWPHVICPIGPVILTSDLKLVSKMLSWLKLKDPCCKKYKGSSFKERSTHLPSPPSININSWLWT